jgi:PPOX class probable F420-dependent enzyme
MAGPTPPSRGAMRPEELDAFLRRPLLARLATIDPDGYPAIVPLWHEWDGSALWLLVRAKARFADDLRRDPRVGVSIVADDDPDRRVQIRGRATIVGGPAPLEGPTLELARRMAERYEGEAGARYVDASRWEQRLLVRVDPEGTRTWTSPDWHPRYAGDTT